MVGEREEKRRRELKKDEGGQKQKKNKIEKKKDTIRLLPTEQWFSYSKCVREM